MSQDRKQASGVEDELTTEMIRDADEVFDEWLVENADLIRDMGGTGNTHQLFAALWAVWKKEL